MTDDAQRRSELAAEVAPRDAFDAALTRAFADVSLPPGLLNRLTISLAEEIAASEEYSPEVQATGSAARAVSPVVAVAAAEGRDGGTTTRRRWLVGTGGALAASIAGGFWLWQNHWGRNELSFEELLDEALAYMRAHPTTSVTLHAAAKRSPPVDSEAVQQAVLLPADVAWWQLADRVAGRLGVALELTAAPSPRAVLLLLDRPDGNPVLPPLAREPMRHPATTGGCAVGVWRCGNQTAVLVVEGDAARYARFLQSPRLFA